MNNQDSLIDTAIVYDFDGTLAPGNIQEHSLLSEVLGVTAEEFWESVAREKQAQNADEILIYLRQILEVATHQGVSITRKLLREHGANTPLFEGVVSWFSRIGQHAKERGLNLQHFVVSSGNHEMIEGSCIAPEFTAVFASRYVYDAEGNAVWPAIAINYTTKTQYLFRINKGVTNSWENESVNRWIPMDERPMPFSRMIYIGDGDTDIPSMKMVRHQGGHSIAVFDPANWNTEDPDQRAVTKHKAYNLIAEDRAHFVVPADYREGSQLDITVKGVLGRIARDAGFRGDDADP